MIAELPELITRAEAKARGLKRFFTGKQCKRGHISIRRVSDSSCLECRRAEDRVRYQADPGKVNQRAKEWAAANPERARERARAWVAANREKDREKGRRYAREHPEQAREACRRRDAAKLKATPAWADRAAILAVYAEAERLTRETGVPHHVDHIVPLKHPLVCGLHVGTNLRAIPASENRAKGNRWRPETRGA